MSIVNLVLPIKSSPTNTVVGEMYVDTGVLHLVLNDSSRTDDRVLTVTTATPGTNDGAALGSATVSWADLFLASGAVINFNNGDLTLTHSSNVLAFAGGTYTFAGAVNPATSDGSALGTTALMWSDLFLASGGVINFNNGDVTLTHSANTLTLASGVYVISASDTPASVGTTPGTNNSAAVTSTGGLGGNTTIGTTGTAGNGGGYSFTGGAGGVASAATTAATGGIGGAWTILTGAGGAEAVTGVTATGGAGGAISETTGDGGAVSAAVSGTATGGASGAISFATGTGGAVTATTGTNVGGASGTVTISSGIGGAASGATDTGGASGAVLIATGTGGAGDTGGASGNLTLRTGAPGSGGSPAVGDIIFQVSGSNTQWTIDGATGNLVGEAGNIIQSNASGEIAFCVTNETLTIGAEGSVILPYRSSTDAAFDDTAGGNLDGAIGIQYDSDTGPTSTIEVRSNGAWVSVAVSGYEIQGKTVGGRDGWWHDNQLLEPGFVDETLCVVCGEQMEIGNSIAMYGNYLMPHKDARPSLHAVFGHQHIERDENFTNLSDRVVTLENTVKVLRVQLNEARIPALV